MKNDDSHENIMYRHNFCHDPCKFDCPRGNITYYKSSFNPYITEWDLDRDRNNFHEYKVPGINYSLLNSKYHHSGIYTQVTPTSQTSLALYPSLEILSQPNQKDSYTYHIFHGTLQRAGVAKGFTLQTLYANLNATISMNLTDRAVGFRNPYRKNDIQSVGDTITFHCTQMLWVEPDLEHSHHHQDLSGTIITSDIPINVFTNTLLSTTPEYNTTLVHQMPERRYWGRTFVIDTNHSRIIPGDIEQHIVNKITIVSYELNNSVLVKTSSSTERVNIINSTQFEDQYEYSREYDRAELDTLPYIKLQSDYPILVMLETYTALAAPSNTPIYYSILVQPVEWYANKQSLVLVHPLQDAQYDTYYHISVIVASKNDTNPNSIVMSEPGKYCDGLPIGNYSDLKISQVGESMTLLTYEMSSTEIHSTRNQTEFLIHHSNPTIHIGVTIYAYSEKLQYAYSNGYTLGMFNTHTYTSK